MDITSRGQKQTFKVHTFNIVKHIKDKYSTVYHSSIVSRVNKCKSPTASRLGWGIIILMGGGFALADGMDK